jgi:ATP adenylyltransferase/5',5'''-P-1,P-4-tetraphosphate phosphorylase II
MKRAHLDEHTMLTPSTFQMVYRIDDKLLGLVFRNTGACAPCPAIYSESVA